MKLSRRILLIIASLFVVFLISVIFWMGKNAADSRWRDQIENSNDCKNFKQKLTDQLSQIYKERKPGDSKVITLDNTLKADICVIFPHYMSGGDATEKYLISLGVPKKAAGEIASFDFLGQEGYYLYLIRGDSLICQGYSGYAHVAKQKQLVSRIGDKIEITVQVDPNDNGDKTLFFTSVK